MIKANGMALSLAAAGLVLACSARAAATYNGDLVIGFTAGVGNDLVYDLAAPASLTDGQTWNLNSLLAAGGFDLSSVQWGVVASQTTSTNRVTWCTKSSGTPPNVTGNSMWASIDHDVQGIYGQLPTAGAGQYYQPDVSLANSWWQQTVASPSSGSFHIAYANPNATGETNLNFYIAIANNTAPKLMGHFSLAANGVVTFTTNSVVPPPPTPPVPQIVLITRTNATSTVYFTTTNNAAFTYKLYYTNSAGLNTSLSNWTASAGSVVGNGQTNSITDTTTDLNRFYGVGVH
jgi:hypothetical protein